MTSRLESCFANNFMDLKPGPLKFSFIYKIHQYLHDLLHGTFTDLHEYVLFENAIKCFTKCFTEPSRTFTITCFLKTHSFDRFDGVANKGMIQSYFLTRGFSSTVI